MKKTQIVSTTHFYNSIAWEYDRHLSNPKDEAVRKEVATFFKNTVQGKAVMDFGAGTGLDLPWLIESGYQVYFCEPAENMKNQAKILSKEYEETLRPVFFEKSDFTLWRNDNLPVEEKLSAVLANFGVLNYIDDLPLLFEKFFMLLDDKGSIVANVLDASPAKLFLKYLKNTLKAFLSGEKIKTGSQYKGLRHETILYSIYDIEKAAEKYFVLKKYKKLSTKSDFSLLHLVKK